ncbi:uncharacterized protein HaLaN_12311, partial [Haematococcus lacustris]
MKPHNTMHMLDPAGIDQGEHIAGAYRGQCLRWCATSTAAVNQAQNCDMLSQRKALCSARAHTPSSLSLLGEKRQLTGLIPSAVSPSQQPALSPWRAKHAQRRSTSTLPPTRVRGHELPSHVAHSSASPAATPAPRSDVADYLQLWAGLAALYGVDVALKTALLAQGIKFPGPLVGMFGVVAALLVVGDKSAAAILDWFGPCLNWIAKWLPLFYVASLVTLPLNLSGIAGDQLLKIVIILCGGMVATLLFTAQTAVAIRALVKTENKEVSKAKAASPYLAAHWVAWGGLAVASLAATLADPAGLGSQMALPFNLSATLLGFLLGNAMPKA